ARLEWRMMGLLGGDGMVANFHPPKRGPLCLCHFRLSTCGDLSAIRPPHLCAHRNAATLVRTHRPAQHQSLFVSLERRVSMNVYFAVAGVMALLLGLAHSILGEILLLRRLTNDHLPPIAPFSLIELPKLGLMGSADLARLTLRFTWHLPTVLGAAFGA